MDRAQLAAASEAYIRDTLQRRLPAQTRVYLYGSRARRDARWNSDYDLWIDSDIPDALIGRIQDDLEDSFVPYKVDIVTTPRLHGPFGEQVKKEAVRWI